MSKEIEVVVSERKRGGRRMGAGRPALVRENNARIAAGLPPIPTPKPKQVNPNTILKESTKKRSQEILAVMLSTKSKAVVKKILDKALDDEDKDQMECLKIVMDRILPKDYIAKSAGKGNAIQINISGVGQVEAIEHEVEEDEVEDEL